MIYNHMARRAQQDGKGCVAFGNKSLVAVGNGGLAVNKIPRNGGLLKTSLRSLPLPITIKGGRG